MVGISWQMNNSLFAHLFIFTLTDEYLFLINGNVVLHWNIAYIIAIKMPCKTWAF